MLKRSMPRNVRPMPESVIGLRHPCGIVLKSELKDYSVTCQNTSLQYCKLQSHMKTSPQSNRSLRPLRPSSVLRLYGLRTPSLSGGPLGSQRSPTGPLGNSLAGCDPCGCFRDPAVTPPLAQHERRAGTLPSYFQSGLLPCFHWRRYPTLGQIRRVRNFEKRPCPIQVLMAPHPWI